MRIFVTVKPKSRKEDVVKVDVNHFVVYVTVLPEKGKANEAVRKKMSEYFNVPKSYVTIISGLTSRKKIVQIIFSNKEEEG